MMLQNDFRIVYRQLTDLQPTKQTSFTGANKINIRLKLYDVLVIIQSNWLFFSFLDSQLFNNGMLAVETVKDQFCGQPHPGN